MSHPSLIETVYDNEYKGRPPKPFQAFCTCRPCTWRSAALPTLKAAQNAFQSHYGEVHSDQPDVSG